MNGLYVCCHAGISGDMLVGGFIDMGMPLSRMRRALSALGLGRIPIRPVKVLREGTSATRLQIGRQPELPPRRAAEIIRFVRGSRVERNVKRRMVRAFEQLANAESAAHGKPWARTLFYQLAQSDTLLDVAGICVGLEHFGVDRVHTSSIPLGCRYMDHHDVARRRPGPATVWLLRRFTTVRREQPFEWSTPTGATFLRAFATPQPPPPMRMIRAGHSIGTKLPPHGPTVLRLLLGKSL